jgi:hypothetical protein
MKKTFSELAVHVSDSRQSWRLLLAGNLESVAHRGHIRHRISRGLDQAGA